MTDSASGSGDPKGGCALQAVRITVASTAAMALAATLVGFAGHLWTDGLHGVAGLLTEVAASFRFQYLWISAFLAAASLVLRRPAWAAVSAATVAVNLSVIASLYLPASEPPTGLESTPANSRTVGSHQIGIIQFNAQSSSAPEGFDSFARFARESDPDLVAVEDLAPEWARRFRTEFPSLTPAIELPLSEGGGIGLYSRIPIEDARLRYFADAEPGLATITARMTIGNAPVDLIVTHPMAPTSPHTFDARNEQLAAIASERTRFARDLIVVGDLNMTSWSPAFGQFSSAMGVRDTRKGFGVQGSWPAGAPGFRVPIDHCLVSERFATRERRVGPAAGSQHLPILVLLELP